MGFARRVFMAAGVYGLIVMTPQLFLEARLSRDYPPAITHAELYYGFVGTALAWQVAFLVIARDPERYRPLMPSACLEKGIFGAVIPVLYLHGRVSLLIVIFAAIDIVLGILFYESWRRTKPRSATR